MVKDVNRIYFSNCNHSLKFTASLQQVKYLDTFPHSVSRLICPPQWYFSYLHSPFLRISIVSIPFSLDVLFIDTFCPPFLISAVYSRPSFSQLLPFSTVIVFHCSHHWFFLLHFILETFIIQSNAPSKDTFISHSDPYFFLKFSIKLQYIFCLSPDDYSIFLSLLKRKAR